VRALLAELDRKALGVVHFFADPDKLRAEYAIAVRSDWKGRGVGYPLMSRLIVFQHRRGTPPINCLKILSCLADLPLGRGHDRRPLGPHQSVIFARFINWIG
jgi:acetyltransferase